MQSENDDAPLNAISAFVFYETIHKEPNERSLPNACKEHVGRAWDDPIVFDVCCMNEQDVKESFSDLSVLKRMYVSVFARRQVGIRDEKWKQTKKMSYENLKNVDDGLKTVLKKMIARLSYIDVSQEYIDTDDTNVIHTFKIEETYEKNMRITHFSSDDEHARKIINVLFFDVSSVFKDDSIFGQMDACIPIESQCENGFFSLLKWNVLCYSLKGVYGHDIWCRYDPKINRQDKKVYNDIFVNCTINVYHAIFAST